MQGLEKMNTIQQKQEFETRLTEWIGSDNSRKLRYGDILPAYRDLYEGLKEYTLVNNYTSEVFNGIEAVVLARRTYELASLYRQEQAPDAQTIKKTKDAVSEYAAGFFKDYDRPTDQQLFAAMLTLYGETLNSKWLSPE